MYKLICTIIKFNRKGTNALLKRTLCSLFFVLCSQLSIAQVKTSIDTTSIKIGEELRIQFEIEADSTDLVVFPDQQSFLPMEVIESYETDTTFEASKFKYRKEYGLTQFDSGNYTIPRQKIIFNNKFYLSDSIQVEVRDVAVDTTKQQMFDIKPVVDIKKSPFDFMVLLYWMLPILLIAAGIFFYLRRKKIKREREKELPPYEEAIVALQELDKSDYLLQNKSKEYYSLLTTIVKRYLDREVDKSAQESTTDELIERLQEHKKAGHFDFDTEDIKKLESILKRADLVKFAKMQQASGQSEADRNAVEEIIHHTHEAIPEPTEEELLLDALYREEQRKKRIKKRVLFGTLGTVSTLLLAFVILSSIYGYDVVKDKVFGHPTREMAEGTWVKSDYGAPGIIIETPHVLLRKPVEIPEEARGLVVTTSLFEYGSFTDDFSIRLNTTTYRDSVPLNLEQSLEMNLQKIEENGALNLVVKREDFETETGIKGLKAYGDFNLKYPNGKIAEEKLEYTLLMFQQEQSMQLVLILNNKQDFYASKVKNRIMDSIELEVTEKQAQNAK